MKLPRNKRQRISGGLFVLFGIFTLTIAILLTPALVARYLLADHSITPGGIILLDQYRSFLAFGGILSLVFGFLLLPEGQLKLTESNKLRLVAGLVIAICSLGVLLRIYFFLIDRSLWLDEAKLALNIVRRSFSGLLQPLDMNQGAPIGFLLAEKLVVGVLGNKDYALRVIPLISGLASIPLVYLVAKKFGGQLFACTVLALFSFSERLIYYSSEAKQYATDVLAALVILLIAADILEKEPKPRPFIMLGIAGVLTMWFSHPSVFVFGGVLLIAGIVFLVKRRFKPLMWLIAVGIVWGASLGLDYFVSLRYSASNGFLLDFWSGSFAPLPPWSNIKWYFNSMKSMLQDPATLPANLLTALLLILGIVSFTIRRWQSILILLMPFGLVLAASALGKYPFSGRLILFLVPFLFIFLVEGIGRFRSLLQRFNRPLAGLFTAFFILYFLWGPVSAEYHNVISPPMGQDIKPAMAFVSKNRINNDLIYVYRGAGPAFMFYAPEYHLNENSYIGMTSLDDPKKYLEEIDGLGKGRQIWFLFTNNCSRCMVNEQVYILDHLDKVGARISENEFAGASVYLYYIK